MLVSYSYHSLLMTLVIRELISDDSVVICTHSSESLNWPWWKKEACFWSLYVWTISHFVSLHQVPPFRAFAASLDGALSPMMGAGYVLLAQQFNVSVNEITSSFGFIILGLASFMWDLCRSQSAIELMYAKVDSERCSHQIWTPDHLPRFSLIGRSTKPSPRVYFDVDSCMQMFISCVWCALSPNVTSIRASRVFQGFGMSALQRLVISSIRQVCEWRLRYDLSLVASTLEQIYLCVQSTVQIQINFNLVRQHTRAWFTHSYMDFFDSRWNNFVSIIYIEISDLFDVVQRSAHLQLCHPKPDLAMGILVRQHTSGNQCPDYFLLRPWGEKSFRRLCSFSHCLHYRQTSFVLKLSMQNPANKKTQRRTVA